MPQRVFSIVIPTRNRPDTLRSTIETCLGQRRFDDYDIVINDNGDGSATQDYIAGLVSTDARARDKIDYHKRSAVCSMSENFEEAVGRARGSYVIVLGDDDGILPLALYELDKIIREHGCEVVRWRNGLYNWPQMTFSDAANYLGFSVARFKKVRSFRSELNGALTTFDYSKLPMLYINAAISRKVIAIMRDCDEKIFRSPSPDVYSAIVLAYKQDSYLDVSVPFTLAGLSRHSNGVSSAFGGVNKSPREDFGALNLRGGIRVHEWVPDLSIYPAVATADSFYHAKNRHFPDDESIQLPRDLLMENCVARADTADEAVRAELLRACSDDADLVEFTRGLLANKTETLPAARLRPADLGFDGDNLHLDGRDFGVSTIAEAVSLVHRIVWPADGELRYDVPGATQTRDDLATVIDDLHSTRGTLVERSASLQATLGDLDRTRGALVGRSTSLQTTLDDLERTRGALVERTASLEGALNDLQSVRETLVDRTRRLEAAMEECAALRGRLVAST